MANFFSQRMKRWNIDNDICGLWNHSSLRKKQELPSTISKNNSSSKNDSSATVLLMLFMLYTGIVKVIMILYSTITKLIH